MKEGLKLREEDGDQWLAQTRLIIYWWQWRMKMTLLRSDQICSCTTCRSWVKDWRWKCSRHKRTRMLKSVMSQRRTYLEELLIWSELVDRPIDGRATINSTGAQPASQAHRVRTGREEWRWLLSNPWAAIWGLHACTQKRAAQDPRTSRAVPGRDDTRLRRLPHPKITHRGSRDHRWP